MKNRPNLPNAIRALMTNDHDDPFRVWIYARKKTVAGWTCRTQEDADRTARAFLAASDPSLHRRASIRGTIDDEEIVTLVTTCPPSAVRRTSCATDDETA